MSRVQKFFSRPSRTKQAFKAECDINEIVKRFRKIAGPDCLEKLDGYAGGLYGDFSEVVDYRTARDQIIAAEASFEALPAIVRKRFGNDPAEFLDFCQNSDNIGELRAMGLAKPAPTVVEPSV